MHHRLSFVSVAGRYGMPPEPIALTPRQQAVLSLIAQGFTNREVASRLRISARTVEVHRFSLMQRLRAHNAAQLLRQAFLSGLLKKADISGKGV